MKAEITERGFLDFNFVLQYNNSKDFHKMKNILREMYVFPSIFVEIKKIIFKHQKSSLFDIMEMYDTYFDKIEFFFDTENWYDHFMIYIAGGYRVEFCGYTNEVRCYFPSGSTKQLNFLKLIRKQAEEFYINLDCIENSSFLGFEQENTGKCYQYHRDIARKILKKKMTITEAVLKYTNALETNQLLHRWNQLRSAYDYDEEVFAQKMYELKIENFKNIKQRKKEEKK